MENIIYYFTGTGNSLMVARMLAQKLEGETELRPVAREVDEACIVADAEQTVGFIFPVYGGQAPWPMMAAAEKMRIPKGVYLYAIGTCNERGGTCTDLFNCFLKKQGYALSYARKLDMPGNCLPSNEAENAQRLELAKIWIDVIAKNINARFVGTVEDFDSPDNNTKAVREKYAQQPFGPWRVNGEACTSCGLCAKLCPMENIALRGGTPQFADRCAYCFACFHFCPQKAIYKDYPHFGSTDGRPRYHHPAVTWKDIAAQRKGR